MGLNMTQHNRIGKQSAECSRGKTSAQKRTGLGLNVAGAQICWCKMEKELL